MGETVTGEESGDTSQIGGQVQVQVQEWAPICLLH